MTAPDSSISKKILDEERRPDMTGEVTVGEVTVTGAVSPYLAGVDLNGALANITRHLPTLKRTLMRVMFADT